MALGPPPPAFELIGMPAIDLSGRRAHRVHLASRSSPWWFSSAKGGAGGRFDLEAPLGTCYLAAEVSGSVIEAFAGFGRGALPISELRRRRRAEVVCPPRSPRAADLCDRRARGLGVTAALWAGDDRRITQAWAAALRRSGWLAVWSGASHDPSGTERNIALFDLAGEHVPYDDTVGWAHFEHRLDDDPVVTGALAGYGIAVIADPSPETVPLEESGLLD